MGKELFVDQSIEVNTPAQQVWRVITEAPYIAEWACEFRNGQPFRIESGWQVGDLVLWKDETNKVLVEGEVTVRKYPTLLRFTVFEAGTPHAAVTLQDGITWELIKKDPNTTIVRGKQGDFGALAGGKEKYKITEKTWNRVLPKVKKLAEQL